MDKELLRTIISENQEYIGSIPLVERPLDLEEYGNYVFVGVRQAGKSYLLYQRVQQFEPLKRKDNRQSQAVSNQLPPRLTRLYHPLLAPVGLV